MFTLTDNRDGTFIVSRICSCGNETSACVTDVELGAYNQGAFVQEAFPSLTDDMREAIFISGFCSDCWDEIFSYDEDGNEDDYPEDNYYSGTGELVGDDSYIDYLNRD